VLSSLQGKLTEAELTAAVAAEHDAHRRLELLTEALFYTGQKHLVEDHPDRALQYFKATIGLQVPYFIEHHLAGAELQKRQHREGSEQDTAHRATS
jgi:lipoprotein NlpI